MTLFLPQAMRLKFATVDRVYDVVLEEDLFEQWMVVQSWGGKGNMRGGGKITHVETFQKGIALLEEITQRRKKRGYALI